MESAYDKIITVEDVLKAAVDNGLGFAKGAFFRGDDRYVRYSEYAAENNHPVDQKYTRACTVGMAAYNLGVNPKDLELALGAEIFPVIENVNDSEGVNSFEEVYQYIKTRYPNWMQNKIRIRKEYGAR